MELSSILILKSIKVVLALTKNYITINCEFDNWQRARTIRNGADPTGGSVSVSNALMYSVWGYRPVSPTGANLMEQLYDDAVEMTEDYRFNPLMTARNEYKKTTTDNLNINGMAEYSFTENLRLRVTGGYQVVYYINEQFNNSKTKPVFIIPKTPNTKGLMLI